MINDIFRKIIFLLPPLEKVRSRFLFLMIAISAILDTVGIALIFPFMKLVSDKDIINNNIYAESAYRYSKSLGVDNINDFYLLASVLLFIYFLFNLFFRGVTQLLLYRFIFRQELNLSEKLLSDYLHRPYKWFLSAQSSDLNKNILSEVSVVTNKVFLPFATFVTQVFTIVAIITMLVFINVKVTLTIAALLLGTYFFIHNIVKSKLSQIGEIRAKANGGRFRIVRDAFGAIKEVKSNGIEAFFTKSFSYSAGKFATAQSSAHAITDLPRYFLEILSFGGLVLAIMLMILDGQDFSLVIPVLSVYAFAAFRLIPCVNQIYTSISIMRFSKPSLDMICSDYLCQPSHPEETIENALINYKDDIRLTNVSFSYLDSRDSFVKDLSFTIPYGHSTAIFGFSGSGKSTIVDIILGLLSPLSGGVYIGNTQITKDNARLWRTGVGYVPQRTYLVDDTLAKNIALGKHENEIDYELLIKVSKIACVDSFVKELPNGYQEVIGNDGMCLSGGQCQRIGVARALYTNPEVIILDEATSALDIETEDKVMQLLKQTYSDRTLILVSHRVELVNKCDYIIDLN